MADNLYIAWQYMKHHKLKTVVMLITVSLLITLPVVVRVFVEKSEQRLTSRAEATPLIFGAKGSSLDLAINALYFVPKPVAAVSMDDVDTLDEYDLAELIPLHTRFHASDVPIVGTTLEYFEFRQLHVASGRMIGLLGECIIGADVAKAMNVEVGDAIYSSPENVFDLAGVYPLKMTVVGIFEPTMTPDDLAVFVDIKTAWVIQGLGHGHQDLEKVDDSTVIQGKKDGNIRANAKLTMFNEITDANIDTFHFHGAATQFPLTAIIVLPKNQKASDLLRGKYVEEDSLRQLIQPEQTISELMATLFRIEGILNAGFALTGCAATLLMVLVIILSLRLRQRELEIMYQIGCSRLKVFNIVASELGIVIGIALIVATGCTLLTLRYADIIIHSLVL